MEEDINISLNEVANSASAIRNLNTKLDESLSYAYRLMNELGSVWQSDGQDNLLTRFNNFANRFIDESETIESYAKFLDRTVSNYDSLESTISANASNFE